MGVLFQAGATGTDAAALVLAAEGSEGGSTTAAGVIVSSSGCFPSFWTGADFTAWLNGNLTGAQVNGFVCCSYSLCLHHNLSPSLSLNCRNMALSVGEMRPCLQRPSGQRILVE